MTSKEKKEEIAELKELFEKARKQYNLPSFDELDEEFEIRKIEDGFVLREIRRDMLDRLHHYIEWIGPIVNPSQHSMHSMIESKLFAKKELEEIFDYYRRLYYYIHKGILAGLK